MKRGSKTEGDGQRGRKKGKGGGGLEGWGLCVKMRLGALKGKLLRCFVKSQLDNLTALTFSLKSPPCDLLKTHLTY